MSVVVSGMATVVVDTGGNVYADSVLIPELVGIDIDHVNGNTVLVAAVTKDGRAWLWGKGGRGLLGDGSSDMMPVFRGPRRIPPHIFGDCKVSMVCPSDLHLVVLDERGRLFVSGDSYEGTLGLGARRGLDRYVLIPMQITDPEFVSVPTKFIATGYSKTIAHRVDGSVYTWGNNRCGVLGLGHDDEVFSPTRLDIVTPHLIVHVSTSQHHTVFVMEDGTIRLWGLNQNGQLGLGDKDSRRVPMTHPEIRDATAAACGTKHIIILDRNGGVVVAGNTHCTSIDGDAKSKCMTYKAISDIPKMVSVHAGYKRTVLVSEEGALFEFGSCRDFINIPAFNLNNAAFRCTRTDPPTRIVHPERIRMHGYCLPQERALAFAMLSHIRCGVESMYHGLPIEIVKKIADAAWTPGLDGDPRRLRHECGIK